MVTSPDRFMDAVGVYLDSSNDVAKEGQIRLATIDQDYGGTGNARVVFDGETVVSTKAYTPLGFTPTPGTRVVMMPVGGSYVIIGQLGTGTVKYPGISADGYIDTYIETTAAAFGALAGGPSAAFIASDSGAAIISIKTALVGTTAGTLANMGFEVRTSGGAQQVAPVEKWQLTNPSNDNGSIEVGLTARIGGLTPGATYTANAMYRRGGGTGLAGFARRYIAAVPT